MRHTPLPLWGLLLLVWCGGLLSATGIGTLRGAAANVVSGGGALAGLFLLAAAGVAVVCQVGAVLVLLALAKRCELRAERPAAVALGTLLLGGIGMVTLNTVLVSGSSFFPPFGPVSILLLCLPYPLAFTLLGVRRRWVGSVTVAAALLLAALVVPIHTRQEQLAAQVWLADHPGVGRQLLRAVDWPGGEQSDFETGSYGVRTTVFFQDSNVDGASDAVVTVAPPTADPCGPVSVIEEGQFTPGGNATGQEGAVAAPVASCTRTGPRAWTISAASGWTGYAELRDGVLLTLSVDSNRAGDNLPAIARTLHPLDDHLLWPYLANGLTWSWLLE